jgi:uncharacterized protein
MQLGQPIQGTHPAESGLSILDYLLHEQATISDEMGVFLDRTYRMHSQVNQFISRSFYENRLDSDPDNDRQIIEVPSNYQGILNKTAGIHFVGVNHQGNTQASKEEVLVIKQLAQELIGRKYTDKPGNKKQLTIEDMLFVAPYNYQVNLLQEALDIKAKVGSVDKFQGQEAPVVFLSMCSSNSIDSPRGIDFLFDLRRLNVAISRAQTLAIIVGNPELAMTQTNNIKQMKQVNVFSSIVSYAQ